MSFVTVPAGDWSLSNSSVDTLQEMFMSPASVHSLVSIVELNFTGDIFTVVAPDGKDLTIHLLDPKVAGGDVHGWKYSPSSSSSSALGLPVD